MALRNILTDSDPILYKNCRPVTEFNRHLHVLLDDMIETLKDANGVGLAAPQVGVMRRAVIVHTEDGKYLELINPEIVKAEGEQDGPEACLSVPGIYGLVKRPMRVKVKAVDRNGKKIKAEGEGIIARAFCHEIDHLNGKLFTELAYSILKPEDLQDMEQPGDNKSK